jgi:hypothetical protein
MWRFWRPAGNSLPASADCQTLYTAVERLFGKIIPFFKALAWAMLSFLLQNRNAYAQSARLAGKTPLPGEPHIDPIMGNFITLDIE